MTQTHHTPLQDSLPSSEKRFYLMIAIIFFIVFGSLMLMFAFTFIKDLETLRSTPDAIWNFLCGTPTDNDISLPMLLTIAITSFTVSVGLGIWHWRIGDPPSLESNYHD